MVCIDMDGVIVKYERDAYVGENPRWLQPGYFRKCEPDETGVQLLKYFMKMLPLDTFIATGVHTMYRNGMVLDKLNWIVEHVPEFDIGTRFIANSALDKSALFEHLRMSSLNKHDVLIDDYNPRLFNWEMRGGTAIKYLNGINSRNSWHGVCIGHGLNMTVEDMFMKVMEATACR